MLSSGCGRRWREVDWQVLIVRVEVRVQATMIEKAQPPQVRIPVMNLRPQCTKIPRRASDWIFVGMDLSTLRGR